MATMRPEEMERAFYEQTAEGGLVRDLSTHKSSQAATTTEPGVP